MLVALLLAAGSTAATGRAPRVSLASRPSGLVAGRPWNAVLIVRGSRPARIALTAVSGRRRVVVPVRRWRNERYRCRLLFPVAGRWSLTARVGGKRYRLGAVLVRARAPVPLVLAYPTAAVLDRDGSLFLVETG
ncbi:MAG TPA: hypothetical protein VFT18_06470, partial [Gaiellaceae bacterium]|nr:hypothetical protein [Gaiellaceae bacterium]